MDTIGSQLPYVRITVKDFFPNNWPAWQTKPSWFLLAEDDRMIAPETQRYMGERMGARIRSHNVDHSPMHTAPEIVIAVILEAAREALAQ